MKTTIDALVEIRAALHAANEQPNGPINDTIWMPGGNETLFDAVDAALALARAEQSNQLSGNSGGLNLMGGAEPQDDGPDLTLAYMVGYSKGKDEARAEQAEPPTIYIAFGSSHVNIRYWTQDAEAAKRFSEREGVPITAFYTTPPAAPVAKLEPLQTVADKLRQAGATLPAPEPKGTIESAMQTGLSIALALVEAEIEVAHNAKLGNK